MYTLMKIMYYNGSWIYIKDSIYMLNEAEFIQKIPIILSMCMLMKIMR